ncbi:hypothetical protein EON67_05830 [archaeon]|nr:MAG: hypothetical protein EON67_05830 [archaeon]
MCKCECVSAFCVCVCVVLVGGAPFDTRRASCHRPRCCPVCSEGMSRSPHARTRIHPACVRACVRVRRAQGAAWCLRTSRCTLYPRGGRELYPLFIRSLPGTCIAHARAHVWQTFVHRTMAQLTFVNRLSDGLPLVRSWHARARGGDCLRRLVPPSLCCGPPGCTHCCARSSTRATHALLDTRCTVD